jgi:hypothetical protein
MLIRQVEHRRCIILDNKHVTVTAANNYIGMLHIGSDADELRVSGERTDVIAPKLHPAG